MEATAERGINRRLDIVATDSLKLRMTRYTSTTPDTNGCLIWTGAQRNSYGAIKHEGRVLQSHCVAFVLAGGEMIQGHVIAHKCDVKLCVNPDHLECVTAQKNNADAHARRVRYAPRGEEIPNAVLNDEIVKTIKRLYVPRKYSYVRIARELGLNEKLVHSVVSGKTWRHVSI
jgi:hypothetical protein